MVDDFRGRGGSPWGTPPGGNGSGRRGPKPPDIDEVIRKIQSTINRFFPGGSGSTGSKKPSILGILILVLIWVASGLYRVLPDEQGVVMRFGKFVKTTQPGLNLSLIHI